MTTSLKHNKAQSGTNGRRGHIRRKPTRTHWAEKVADPCDSASGLEHIETQVGVNHNRFTALAPTEPVPGVVQTYPPPPQSDFTFSLEHCLRKEPSLRLQAAKSQTPSKEKVLAPPSTVFPCANKQPIPTKSLSLSTEAMGHPQQSHGESAATHFMPSPPPTPSPMALQTGQPKRPRFTTSNGSQDFTTAPPHLSLLSPSHEPSEQELFQREDQQHEGLHPSFAPLSSTGTSPPSRKIVQRRPTPFPEPKKEHRSLSSLFHHRRSSDGSKEESKAAAKEKEHVGKTGGNRSRASSGTAKVVVCSPKATPIDMKREDASSGQAKKDKMGAEDEKISSGKPVSFQSDVKKGGEHCRNGREDEEGDWEWIG